MEKNEDNLQALRHSASHIMAQAVKELYPDVKLAIGPAIADGFYYDFDKKEPFTPEDLEKISQKMKEIVKQNLKFEHYEKPRDEAIKYFQEKGEKYKVELINDLPDANMSFYKQGDFVDLCKGPHVGFSGSLKHYKLLSIAGAYWRGDEKRESLQRIYGTIFFTKEELDKHLALLEEAKARDHRKLGKELDLFSVHEETGPGLIFWHPKGALIRKIIEDFWKDEHLKNDYQLLNSPHIGLLDLWKTSGHWNFYRENMYSPMDVDGQDYMIKPMNCPFHIMVYKTHLHSYRELPIRYAELGTVYRYERSGVLHGLMRVRGFTQDDAHIFCRLDQLEAEIVSVIKFVLFVLQTFGFKEYEVYVSTRPEKYAGELEHWEKATDALKKALEQVGLAYQIDPGEGVFYGPKIDIKIKDCLNRSWQCSTIQVDFNLPEAFKVEYVNEESKTVQPVMIHRALMGSLERFFGVLIEHYKGAFPVWISPVQAKILNITDSQEEYARKVLAELKNIGIRAELDARNEKLGLKIREAQLQKIPYMLVIGDKEKENGTVALRRRNSQEQKIMALAEFISLAQEEIKNKL